MSNPAPPRRRKLLALKLLLFALAIEAACRLIALVPGRLSFYVNNWQTHRFLQAVDPATGAGLMKPGVRYQQMNPDGGFVEMRSDSRGYRNDFEYQKGDWVALGDSFVVSYGTDLEKIWYSLLGKKLGRRIYALGSGNTGPAQETELFFRMFPRAEDFPETVVWMIFSGNDLQDDHKYVELGERPPLPSAKPLESLLRLPLEYSYTLRVLSATHRIQKAKHKYRTAFSGGKRHELMGSTLDFFYADAPVSFDEEPYRSGLKQVQASILKLTSAARAAGQRLIVVYAASKEEAFASALEERYGVAPGRILSFEEKLEAFCRANGIEFVGLKAPLREATVSGQMLFFKFDGHYNDEGNRVAAEFIERYLMKDQN